MAHALDTTLRFTASTSPVTSAYTCGPGATLLVLGIVTGGATLRAGANPTYGGVPFTRAAPTQIAAASPEQSCELWYLELPPVGISRTIIVPNTGSATLFVQASSYKSNSGFRAAFESAVGLNGTSSNPTTNVIPKNRDNTIVAVLGDGATNNPSAQTQTLLSTNDNGAFSDNHQYDINDFPQNISIGWTVASDDWCMIVAIFSEKKIIPRGDEFRNPLIRKFFNIKSEPTFRTINVNDSVTLTEDVTVTVNPLYISVNDSSSLTESVTVSEYLSINANDSITLTEFVLVTTNPIYIDANDSITLTEFVLVTTNPIYINIGDDTTITESQEVDIGITVNVSDDIQFVLDEIGVTDNVTVVEAVAPISINVNDSITLEEFILVTVNPLYITVNDIITLTESITINEYLPVSVVEDIVLSDVTLLQLNPLQFNVNDTVDVHAIIVTKQPSRNYYRNPLVVDSFNRADSATLGTEWDQTAGVGIGITSNAAQLSDVFVSRSVYHKQTFGIDQWAQFTIKTRANSSFDEFDLFFRANGDNTAVVTIAVSAILQFTQISYEQKSIVLRGVDFKFKVGDTIRGEVIGRSVSIFKNGKLLHTQIFSSSDSTPTSTITKAGFIGFGLYSDDGAVAIEDFQAGLIEPTTPRNYRLIPISKDTDTTQVAIGEPIVNLQINVNDPITLTESVTVNEYLPVNAFDVAFITASGDLWAIDYWNNNYWPVDYWSISGEYVNVVISTVTGTALTINVNDSIALTEDVTVKLYLPVNANDVIALEEFVLVTTNPIYISVNDDITLAESVTINEYLPVNVNDLTTLSEFVQVTVNPLYINVNDSIALTEDVTVRFYLPVNAFDDIVITEFVLVTVNPLYIMVVDSITLTEDVTVRFYLPVSADDSITLTEDITVSEYLSISVFDDLTVTEDVTVRLYLPVNVFDTLTLEEFVYVALNVLSIVVSDDLTVTEDATVKLYLPVNVNDSITLEEFVAVSLALLSVSVFDTLTLEEFVQVTVNPLYINVNDMVTLTDVVNTVMYLSVNTNDLLTLSEFIIISEYLPINVSDATTIIEAVMVSEYLPVNVFDTLTLTDTVTLLINPLQIFVNDDSTLTEAVIVDVVNRILPSAADNISVDENVTVKLYLPVMCSDTLTITERISVRRVAPGKTIGFAWLS